MGFFESIPIIGKLFKGTTDIIKEVVVDKDAQNKIIESLDTTRMALEKELYLAALNVKTIPWVDALHKMGRQIQNYLTIIVVGSLLLLGIEITPTVALIMGGGNVAYQIVKGRGK